MEVATIGNALAALRTMPDVGLISINVSILVLIACPDLGDILASADRPVVLELTEHDRIDDYPRVRQAVDALGPQVRLSVDDAGSGSACLTHVLALRPAFRSWIAPGSRASRRTPVRQALVAGFQHFTQRAGCRLIAEGVETAEQLDTLRGLGVAFGQGYLLGAPQPAPGEQLIETAIH